MHNLDLAYMAENRIPTVNLSNNETMLAIDIPVPTVLPSKEDFQQLKDRKAVMVERVISIYLVKYKEDEEAAFTAIQHEEWEKSTRKSKIINIGVNDENPSSTHGVIKILDKLHAYVPSSEEKVFPLISWGDALPCERHNDAYVSNLDIPNFKQETLVKHFLGETCLAHNAIEDVKSLNTLYDIKLAHIKSDDLYAFVYQKCLDSYSDILKSKAVSRLICVRLAKEGISLKPLKLAASRDINGIQFVFEDHKVSQKSVKAFSEHSKDEE